MNILNKTSNPYVIEVFDVLKSKTLSTREAAQTLASVLRDKKVQTVQLSFQGIDFISRSFAHELKNIMENFKSEKIFVETVVTSEEVSRMLEIVSHKKKDRESSLRKSLPSSEVITL